MDIKYDGSKNLIQHKFTTEIEGARFCVHLSVDHKGNIVDVDSMNDNGMSICEVYPDNIPGNEYHYILENWQKLLGDY